MKLVTYERESSQLVLALVISGHIWEGGLKEKNLLVPQILVRNERWSLNTWVVNDRLHYNHLAVVAKITQSPECMYFFAIPDHRSRGSLGSEHNIGM